MKSIDLLVSEHDNILKMLDVARSLSLDILRGEKVVPADLRAIVSFIRLYADGTHHGKEEEFLFKEMVDELGEMGTNLVRHGMLVEHDLARLYVSNLDAAITAYEETGSDESRLDILVAIGSYCELLKRHIFKENNVVFTFGGRSLSKEALDRVESATEAFEKDPERTRVRREQLESLDRLVSKYLG